MRYVAGIDGGQSGTQAAIADETGRIIGRGSAGPADEIAQDATSTRLHDALNGALEEARKNAKLDEATTFDAIVAGVSGYEGRLWGVPPSLPARTFRIVHDPTVAHAGAFAGGSGVIVIAGTGSAAYVVDDGGATGLHGGFGYLFGDEGSAFWIVRTALAAAALRDDNCAIAQAALARFGQSSMREIFAAFYHGTITRERLASFAREVIDVAQRGGGTDPCARETVAAAHEHLAELAAWATRRPWHWTSHPRAAFVGGLMHDAGFKSDVYRATRAKEPDIEIVEPAYPPVHGAVLMALREAGMSHATLTP